MANNSLPQLLRAYLELCKPIITLSVAFSALTGFIMYQGHVSGGWPGAYLGVLLVAAASSALNQVQEASRDKVMQRTQNRPLPSGKIKPGHALILVILLTLMGTGLLIRNYGILPATLALLTLLIYNGIYTPLKIHSPLAILPGALVGAIPPVIGYTAAGGHALHPHIVLLAFFFFMGQIPHFWLILLRHGEDYAQAGFISIRNYFNERQISMLTLVWTLATLMAAILLPLFGVITTPSIALALALLSLALLASFPYWLHKKRPVDIKRAFMVMNLYFLCIMLAVMADALLRT